MLNLKVPTPTWRGCGILTSPQLSAAVLEFSPVKEKVASREGSDCCVCLCTKQQFRVSGLLGVLGGHPGKGSIRGLHSSTGGNLRTR